MLGIQKVGLNVGIHILPVHYYTSVPNILELRKEQDVWKKQSELPGLFVDLEEQVSNLKAICKNYQGEYAGNNTFRKAVEQNFGPGYGYIEAQALHAFVRHYKPKRILEVGSGVSTYCMQEALSVNQKEMGVKAKLTSVEPHPSQKLQQMSNIELVQQKVQTVPPEVFCDLESQDLLFIDSSHTVKVGGDVNYLILEILPRLKKGVIIHFHDIFFPYDYQREVLKTLFHWPETSLLRAFLCFNPHVKIICCLSLLHYYRKEALRDVFPEYDPQEDINGTPIDSRQAHKHFPSSIYLQIQ